MNSTYKAFWLADGNLVVIDQTQLPFRSVTKTLKTSADATLAIQDMTVRGAGVIGNVAAFGVYLAARECSGDLAKIKTLAAVIRGARPTAVNLMWAVDRVISVLEKSGDRQTRFSGICSQRSDRDRRCRCNWNA